MSECKNCGSEFEPKKGLINYCSLACRNSRQFSEESNQKKSESAKKHIELLHLQTYHDIKCKYCGEQAKYKINSSSYCCEKRANSCPAIRLKNSEALKLAHKEGRHSSPGFSPKAIAKSNETQIARAKENSFGKHISRLTLTAKKYLYEERGCKCEICGVVDWNNKPLTFEIDHIDGDNTNNIKSNLRILCPNCHSQTETYRGKNVNTGKKRFDRDAIVAKYLELGNIHQTLIAMGMSAKGANFSTVRKVLNDNNIKFK